MKSIFEEMGGTYRQVGDYFIPNLVLILSILLYTIFSKKRVFWITTKIHSASLCEFWW